MTEIDFNKLDAGGYEYNVLYEEPMMPIFSLDITNYLLKRGFKLLKVKTNKIHQGKVVFFFEQTPEAEAAKMEAIEKRRATYTQE